MDDVKRCGRLAKLSEKKLLDFSDSMLQSLRKSLQSSRINVLKTYQTAVNQKLIIFLYKIIAVQEMHTTNHEINCSISDALIHLSKRIILMSWMWHFFTEEEWFHLIRKTQDCGLLIIFKVYMKQSDIISMLEYGFQFQDIALLSLWSQ